MEIVRYTPDKKAAWDNFVRESQNGTFLFYRDYMEYHADRFTDFSWIVYDEKGNLIALLPACYEDHTVYSHKGLTYGGLIVARRHLLIPKIIEIFTLFIVTFRSLGIKQFIYKPVPHIFTEYPSEADIYALHHLGATIQRCQLSTAIPLSRPLLFNMASRQRSKKNNLIYSSSPSVAEFWNQLSEVLYTRHNTTPVHSMAEIELLMNRFPNNIKLVEARDSHGSLLCGSLLYITDKTVHFQYIAVNEEGRKSGAFPWLVKQIIDHECRGKEFLDFGTSNRPDNNLLDNGLIDQKYGLGGRPIAFLTFSLTL